MDTKHHTSSSNFFGQPLAGAPPALPPLALSRRARRSLSALVDVLVPAAPEVPRCHERLIDFVAGFLPYLAPLTRFALPLGLWLFEYGTLIFGFSWRPFSRLRVDKRAEYLRRWMHSRLSLKRQLVRGLRSLVQLGYYDLPEVKSYLGYVPDPFVSARVASRTVRYFKQGEPALLEPHAVDDTLPFLAPQASTSR